MSKRKPNRKTAVAAIRGSVPDGKLKRTKITLHDVEYGKTKIAGFTQYGDDRVSIARIGAPIGDNASSITIRGHETRHATRHKRERKKPLTENQVNAGQIVDDVNVETTALPFVGAMLRDYQRAHLATAMTDLKTLIHDADKVKRGEMRDSVGFRNNQLLNALRIKAMLAHYRYGADGKTMKQSLKGSRKLKSIIGDSTSSALHKIIQIAKMPRGRSRAISLLVGLMETEPAEDIDREGEIETEREGELMTPVTHGDALEGKMEIIDLRPKTAHTSTEREISMRYSPDGVHLNATRFVAAIVQGDSRGLFSRRVRQKQGGTVVIDASGSMGVSAENLTALLRLIPQATVAYYSGDDRGRGNLVIYAFKGKRYRGELPEATLQGGNAVDLGAVRWLLANAKPHTLVSDLGFTGGVFGSEIIAHSLV